MVYVVTCSYNKTYTLEKDSTIGILTAGYGDGVPLGLSNCGHVLIRGQRCPILGRVTMDQTVVDLTGGRSVQVGDRATFIGNDPVQPLPVAEVSKAATSIPWETLCNITKRVVRTYTGMREM